MKKQLIGKAENVFGACVAAAADHEQIQQKLHARIGPLTMEKEFSATALGSGR